MDSIASFPAESSLELFDRWLLDMLSEVGNIPTEGVVVVEEELSFSGKL